MPVLATVNDEQLLEWIRLVTDKLVEIEERFYVVDGIVHDGNLNAQENDQKKTPALVIGNTVIEATTFTDE
jgi:hypothetical protein